MGKKNIFAEWAFKYHEAGIPVIPLNGKTPIVQGWTAWSEKEQTYEEVEDLVSRYPHANIGAVLGRWASALDIDTDDPNVLQASPYSPLRRRGKKGHVSLFKPCTIPSVGQGKYPIEFLSSGRQVVLPPSIHPETGLPYNWTGEEDPLTCTDYPDFPKDGMTYLGRVCEKHGILATRRSPISNGQGDNVCLSDSGRNNKLSRMAYAMACDGVPQIEAVKRLLDFDTKEHEIPWFTDPSEPHRGKHPHSAAQRMFIRAVKAAGSKIRIVTELPGPPVEKLTSQYPAPRGLMRIFTDYCASVSNGAQDALGLGGSLALMSAICSNRFKTIVHSYDVWPNLYILNIAHSGFGKETAQRALEEILSPTTLVGGGAYKSGTSILMGLPDQQERLDIIDECSALLKAMGSREDYKSEIVEILSSLYSKSPSMFIGMNSKADGLRYGACWNPCVNILGSTTPSGFKHSVSQEMAAKGLMPRFLLFWQKEIGEFKYGFNKQQSSELLNECSRMVRRILSHEKRVHSDSLQKSLVAEDEGRTTRYDPTLVPFSTNAERLWLEIKRQYFMEGSDDPESFASAFKNRFAEHVAKLSLLDAISLGLADVTVDSVEWAHEVVKAQWEISKELYELASARSDHGRHSIEVEQFIHKRGWVKKSELTARFRNLPPRVFSDILSQLEASEKIEKVQTSSTRGRPALVYKEVIKVNLV